VGRLDEVKAAKDLRVRWKPAVASEAPPAGVPG